ncbi:hypothetical protein CYMTET_42724 [Cymbomonas tetramitiformis]|uniref:RanBP2-type domain-containing protein n=1 Tax=Cymbomonas tetramitiformis TaxID=36881 RepID=A0AAE0F0Q4_9CHLO|nr:hypothetical protein CYMTET_42724 [Cymbomonas tetramitiformis]
MVKTQEGVASLRGLQSSGAAKRKRGGSGTGRGRAGRAGRGYHNPLVHVHSGATVDLSPHITMARPRYLICIDFECTSDENPSLVPREDMEIVEFPWVCLDVSQCRILHRELHYCVPQYSKLTESFSRRTTITQERLHGAGTLADAICALHKYCMQLDGDFCVVTHGTWDLWVQLRQEAQKKNLQLPTYLTRFFDLKAEAVNWMMATQQQLGQTTLAALAESCGIQPLGNPNCGIDNATTIAQIVCCVIATTGYMHPQVDILCRPIDFNQIFAEFKQAAGTVLWVKGLPFEATLSDIRQWCAGVKVAPRHALRVLEHLAPGEDGPRPSDSGFIFCNTHQDAMSLLYNSHSMGKQWLEVWPSTEDQARALRTCPFNEPQPAPLPPSQPAAGGAPAALEASPGVTGAPTRTAPSGNGNNLGMRAGDWLCPGCNDLQFARNIKCRRCGESRPTDAGDLPATHNVREGDWTCPGCSDHQFARNTNCRRCGHPRDTTAAAPQATATAGGNARESSNIGGGVGRGGNGGGGGGGNSRMRPGDWVCGQCGDLQFARNARCRQCGSGKPGGAGAAAPGSPAPTGNSSNYAPVMRDGDWMCGGCGDHQFARNTSCRRCGGPRPSQSLEQQQQKQGDAAAEEGENSAGREANGWGRPQISV